MVTLDFRDGPDGDGEEVGVERVTSVCPNKVSDQEWSMEENIPDTYV